MTQEELFMEKISLSGVCSFSPTKNFDDASECFEVQVPGSWKSVPEFADCDVGVYHHKVRISREKEIYLHYL